MYTSEYVAPILVVDSIIFQLIDNKLCVLLVKRAADPFKGIGALPGGYCAAGETTTDAMYRVLSVKGGVERDDLKFTQQLYTFDTVARDPRGHAVSVSYMGLGKDITPVSSDTTQDPQFYPVTDLPETAYDHADIINYAHERLKSKIMYTNVVYALLDPFFTLTQLQLAYEAILCRPLDKRNFRKKFLSLGLIRETDEFFQEGAHRPARLYRFNSAELESLSRSFD
jgi:8-oxo-dGTP diphosphatase